MASDSLTPKSDASSPTLDPAIPWRPDVGGWVFRHRGWTPLPFVVAIVVLRWQAVETTWLRLTGVLLIGLGEAVRLWAVRHIGVISRTRATRVGPLIVSGPYVMIRNPLYLGNGLLWSGFLVWSGLLWLAPLAGVVFVVQHCLMTRWEERQLRERFGDPYVTYQRTTPRWLPRLRDVPRANFERPQHPWRDVLFSERGTLLAIAALSLLMILGSWLRVSH